jgi:restriction endonuclease Mrr
MAIPDFQTLMLPLLRHLADGAQHNNQDTVDTLAHLFKLSDFGPDPTSAKREANRLSQPHSSRLSTIESC